MKALTILLFIFTNISHAETNKAVTPELIKKRSAEATQFLSGQTKQLSVKLKGAKSSSSRVTQFENFKNKLAQYYREQAGLLNVETLDIYSSYLNLYLENFDYKNTTQKSCFEFRGFLLETFLVDNLNKLPQSALDFLKLVEPLCEQAK